MRRLLALPLLLLPLSACQIPTLQEPVRDHAITLDDYFSLGTITDFSLSPDGEWLVWAEMRWEPVRDGRNTDLWVRRLRGGETRRLTTAFPADHSPQWGPNSQWIYFASSRRADATPPSNGRTQIWKISRDGEGLAPVTEVAGGVEGFELAPDGASAYYSTGRDTAQLDRWSELRMAHDSVQYGHGRVRVSEIWQHDFASGVAVRLVDERRVILEFDVSPDASRIAMVTAPDRELITYEGRSHVDVWHRASDRVERLPDSLWREQAPSPNGWILDLCWADDGGALAFRVDFDGYPGRVLVASVGERASSCRLVRPPGDVTAVGHMEFWPQTRSLCLVADDRARKRIFRVPALEEGSAWTLTPGDVVVETFRFGGDGRLLALLNDAESTPDVHSVERPGENATYLPLTEVNPQVNTWQLPQMRVVRWTSEDGTPVEGILELPPDWQEGDPPLPLLVQLHGGPTAASQFAMRYWIYGRTLFAARGWAMLSPNYRGSTGYGDAFLTDLIGRKNDRDVADILSGVEWAIDAGIADPQRMGVMGWSNGGYLVNCLITRTDRFRAASSGAGVVDTVMQWQIQDTPGHNENFSRGLPWEAAAQMHASSPLYRLDEVRTPTIVHVGSHDERVPAQHARALYRALRHYVGVPTELLVYPGAGHSPVTYRHRRAKLAWDLAWMEHFVLGEGEAPAPGS